MRFLVLRKMLKKSVVIEFNMLYYARGQKVCLKFFDVVLMISINDFNKSLFWSVHGRAAFLFTCVIPRVGCAQTLQSRRPPTGKEAAGWFPWWKQPRVVCLLVLG
jgi:hypothetical protein